MVDQFDPRSPVRKELARVFGNDQRMIRAFEKLFELVPSDLVELLLQVEVAQNSADSAMSATRVNRSFINAINPALRNFILVTKLSDLPKSQSGVINLIDTYTYFFTTVVDLEGARLVSGQNTTILGSSSENCRIKSTGLAAGVALLSSEYSLPLRNITLEAETILDLDATGNPNQALDWYGVNFEGSSDIGTIKNYGNFVATSMAFLGVSGLIFDGTFGTIAFSATLFVGDAIGTIIELPTTAIIERRFRTIYSSVVVPAGGTGFDVSTSAAIPIEGYIFDTCNFSGGGTLTAGVPFDDNKARWTENRSIKNSAAITGYYMLGNATATVIGAVSTPVKVAGTTTEATISQRFTVATTNRATYDGAITRDFRVTVTLSLSSGNNQQIAAYVAKNGSIISESVVNLTTNSGGRLENGMMQVTTELIDTDYIEIFVENNTAATNITVEDMNVIIEALN